MTKRVLVIGIDSGTFDLIKPWAQAGHLPNLGKLIESGVHGSFVDSWLPITAPRWTTISTGKNPGKHGIFDFSNMLTNYKTKPVSSKDIDAKPLYSLISDANKKVLVLNYPITYPCTCVDGHMVAGMPAPMLNEKAVYPLEILEEIKARNYKILPEEVYDGTNEESILKELHEVIDNQCTLAKEFVTTKEWEFCFNVFFNTDIAGHWFWKHMDETHPEHNQRAAKYKDAILDVYKKADKSVGELIEAAGKDTTVFIVSDHGMGPLYKDIFINNWLLQKGFLKLKKNAVSRVKYAMHKGGFTLENMYAIVKKTGLAKLTAKNSDEAENARQFILNNFFISFDDVDWTQTVAFSSTNYGPIFINLKGRQEQGIVNPGEEYEKVCREVANSLLEIKDEKGEQVVEVVKIKREIVSGDHLDQAPDIVFRIKGMKYTTNRYFEFGSNKLFGSPHRGMSGDHRDNGIFIANGPDIKKSSEQVTFRMIDLAPTVLHLLELPIPSDMDGKAVISIFDENSPVFKRKIEINSKVPTVKKYGREMIKRVISKIKH